METIKFISPFDAHLHLREGNMARIVTPMSTKQFSDVIVMPNLQSPVDTTDKALAYKDFLESIANSNYHMALYLTESTTIEEILNASVLPYVIGFKLYPLNATTGSSNGISDIKNIYHLLKIMEIHDVPLLIHGEVTRPEIDIFDREKVFIEEVLLDIIHKFPKLKITLEHITTSNAVNLILSSENNISATITAHHLLMNRNAIFTVGERTALNPHNFCLPIAKSEGHRLALINALMTGSNNFFAGTDSAPHPLDSKESSCGCAGCFTGLHAVELYTHIFSEIGILDKLENFLSINGRSHYGIKIPKKTITINKEEFLIPETIGNEKITPFWAGKTLNWKVK